MKKTIEILEQQLSNGTKPRKNGWSYKDYDEKEVIRGEKGKPFAIKLNQSDIARIKKEIGILRNKL